MKVVMHMSRFQEAKAEGDKLVPASVNPANPSIVVSPIGGYFLTAIPQAPFTANGLSSENIFSIKNDALDNPGINAALGTMFGAANLGARGLVALSPIVWNRPEWLDGDARRSSLFVLVPMPTRVRVILPPNTPTMFNAVQTIQFFAMLRYYLCKLKLKRVLQMMYPHVQFFC
jgi:hypothetical protein